MFVNNRCLNNLLDQIIQHRNKFNAINATETIHNKTKEITYIPNEWNALKL